MEVTALTRDQLVELKGNYLDERMDGGASWGEIADADEIISDAEIFEAYAGTDFGNDDFSCTAGMSDDLFDADTRTLRKIISDYARDISVEDIERNASVVCMEG